RRMGASVEPGVRTSGEMPVAAMARHLRAPEEIDEKGAVLRSRFDGADGRAIGHEGGLRPCAGECRSQAAATWNMRSSAKAGAMICTPTGSSGRSVVAGAGAAGTESAHTPARLAGRVYTSDRYIFTGSSAFSPSRKAGVGLIGVMSASTRMNASSKSFL